MPNQASSAAAAAKMCDHEQGAKGAAANQEMMEAIHVNRPTNLWKCSEEEATAAFSVLKVPKPTLARGEVMVKVIRAALNPSDLHFIAGEEALPEPIKYPTIPGFEGSGVVVESNAGITGWRMTGQRVAFFLQTENGAYAPYVAVPAQSCIVLPDNVSFDAGAFSFVTPLTALSFHEIVSNAKGKAFIQTAAASSLGKMVIRLAAQKKNVRVINVVRRAAQIEECVTAGASREDCLLSSDPDFENKLSRLAKEADARICFDAVGGTGVEKLVRALPPGGTVYVFGALAEEPLTLRAESLLFQGKTVQGFLLPDYLKSKWTVGMMNMRRTLTKLLPTLLSTNVAQSVPAAQFGLYASRYAHKMTGGKICIGPHLANPVGPGEIALGEIETPAIIEAKKRIAEAQAKSAAAVAAAPSSADTLVKPVAIASGAAAAATTAATPANTAAPVPTAVVNKTAAAEDLLAATAPTTAAGANDNGDAANATAAMPNPTATLPGATVTMPNTSAANPRSSGTPRTPATRGAAGALNSAKA